MNIKTRKNPGDDTILYGENGIVDSLGLVNILTSVEQKISDEYKKEIVIADERAMSQRSSPFRTIAALTDYVFKLMNSKHDE
ncbi:hypothetical protein JXL83_04470 [candidate division WOR-3 bacterium]|nr:hypothetical protein [candidate division WOR-3 bacterium]